jgi:hypothetical protein
MISMKLDDDTDSQVLESDKEVEVSFREMRRESTFSQTLGHCNPLPRHQTPPHGLLLHDIPYR